MPQPQATVATTPGQSPGSRLARRQFLKRALLWGAGPAALGIYSTQVEPFWLEMHELPIQLANWPAALDGFRLAHLTDLHAGKHVPLDYLRDVVKRVNDCGADCVVVTGDIVHHDARWVDRAADLLAAIRPPLFTSLGNHDYCHGISVNPWCDVRLADALQSALAERKILCLRNAAASLSHNGGRLWFVGLEDYYTDRMNPQKAFAGRAAGEAVIALSHNPDTAKYLTEHRPQLILSGHTHGGQVRIPGIGAPYLNIFDRRLDKGLFSLGESTLYVSRGVGYIKRIRFCCRPEVPVLILRSAPQRIKEPREPGQSRPQQEPARLNSHPT
ncbi:MAG TPA: metallophosphoesterase [Tepidisphaeraceae bacterium]|jgi:predicted MPP superfamily phosphohydrolase